MTRYKTMIAAALMVAACAGARAQDVSQASPPDPARLALAQQIVAATGGAAQAELQLRTVFSAMQKGMATNIPPESRAVMGPMWDEMANDMVELTPRILDITTRAYAQAYTEQELRDILAFETSTTGQAMVAKGPALRAQVVTATIPLMMNEMPAIMRKAADHTCQQSNCTAAQRTAMENAMSKAFKPSGS